jgi:hypothetical protein
MLKARRVICIAETLQLANITPSRLPARHGSRKQSTSSSSSSSSQQMDLGRHFYLNKILEQYAAKPASRTTLRQLVFFGKTVGRNREKILTVRAAALFNLTSVDCKAYGERASLYHLFSLDRVLTT